MERIHEVTVMGVVLAILLEVSKQERIDEDARIPWRALDALADAFRKGGVDMPENLGSAAS